MGVREESSTGSARALACCLRRPRRKLRFHRAAALRDLRMSAKSVRRGRRRQHARAHALPRKNDYPTTDRSLTVAPLHILEEFLLLGGKGFAALLLFKELLRALHLCVLGCAAAASLAEFIHDLLFLVREFLASIHLF